MALQSGEKLGPYEIVAPIGAGGMGEVYRAQDTRLARTVAVKVLPEHIAQREDLRARFEREARAVASLNHPNICSLFDIGPGYMVLEYIEGETLAARLAKGPAPLETALVWARQLADALDRAHRAGVTHRDVKPGNVMVTRDGVKVLDFGLAKSAGAAAAAETDVTVTLAKALTGEGTVVGTPQYMAPESFEGREVGAAADVWAFGAVVHEMMTGRKTFEGKSYSSLVGAILSSEPADVEPAWMNRILRRCLQKDPEDRYQSMRDVLLDLREGGAGAGATPVAASSARWPWVVAAGALLVAAIGAWAAWNAPKAAPALMQRLTVDLAPGLGLADTTISPTPRASAMAVLSPDAQRVAFVAYDAERRIRLFTRRLDQEKATPLAGTENAGGPFFSPDSRWIGFFAEGKLKKISVEGGATVDLADAPSPLSASWGDGFIAASTVFSAGLTRVPENGGKAEPLTKLAADELAHRWPFLIPGTKTLLYASGVPTAFVQAKVMAERLDTGERRVVAEQASYPRFVAPGFLTFVRNGTLFAVRFDPATLATRGDPTPVLENVKFARDSGGAQFDLSTAGHVLYRVQPVRAQEVKVGWLTPEGAFTPVHTTTGGVLHLTLSPDGRRFSYRLAEDGRTSIWVKDLAGGQARRLTMAAGRHGPSLWTPDSQRVVYNAPDGVYWTRADGSGKAVRLLDYGEPVWWTPDGKRLAVVSPPTARERRPCRTFVVEGDPEQPGVGDPQPCLQNTNALQPTWASTLSPDGRWMGFAAGFTATEQVYVYAYPSGGGPWQIARRGTMVQWSGDGRQVMFVGPDDLLYAARVTTQGDALVAEEPRVWGVPTRRIVFGFGYTFSPSRDGQRVLTTLDPESEASDARVELILNFGEELKRRIGW